MKTRSKLATIALATGMALAGFAAPAQAADTTTTFTLTVGGLAVSAPTSQVLGSVATGAATTASVALGTVSVADGRGALLGSWTASVASTTFTTGAASTNETIASVNVKYLSGLATSTTGTGVFLPGQAAIAVGLGTSTTAFSASAVVGNNTAAWNPTVNVAIPSASVAGTYTGTITHSVA